MCFDFAATKLASGFLRITLHISNPWFKTVHPFTFFETWPHFFTINNTFIIRSNQEHLSASKQIKLETPHEQGDDSIPVTCRKLCRIEHFTKKSIQTVVCKSLIYSRAFQTFLPESHISCSTAIRRQDILRNVIVSGCVIFYQIYKCFINILLFNYWQNACAAGWNAFAGERLRK